MTKPEFARPYLTYKLLFSALLLSAVLVIPISMQLAYAESFMEQLPSLSILEEKQQSIQANSQLKEAQKKRALEYIQLAIDTFKKHQEIQFKIDSLRDRLKNVDEKVKSTQQQISADNKQSVFSLTDTPDGKVSVKLDELNTLYIEKENKFKEKEQNLENFQNMILSLSNTLDEHTTKLSSIEKEISAHAARQDDPLLAELAMLALQIRKAYRTTSIEYLSLQQDNKVKLNALLSAERDLALQETNQLQKSIKYLTGKQTQLQQQSVNQQISEARELQQRTELMTDEVRAIAEQNLHLADEQHSLLARQTLVNKENEVIKRRLNDITKEFEITRNRITLLGHSDAISKMLSNRIRLLPSLRSHRKELTVINTELNQAINRQILIEEDLRNLLPDKQLIDNLTRNFADGLTSESRDEFKHLAMEIIQSRKNKMMELKQNYADLISELTVLDSNQRKLFETADAFSQFIRESQLFVRSASSVSIHDMASIPAALVFFISPDSVLGIGKDLISGFKKNPVIFILIAIGVIGLTLARSLLKKNLVMISGYIGKIRTDNFWYSLRAVLDTMALTLPLPLAVYLVGIILKQYNEFSALSLPLSFSLLPTSVTLFALLFVYHSCRENGLADKHFCWPEKIRIRICTLLRWFIPVTTILTLMFVAVNQPDDPVLIKGLGRPLFVINLLLWAVVIWRLFSSSSEIHAHLRSALANSWITRLRFLWFPVSLLIPLVLISFSLSGYHYTAQHFFFKFLWSVFFIVLLIMVNDLLHRWLSLSEKQLRFQDALNRRDKARERRKSGILLSNAENEIIDEHTDFDLITRRTKQLLNSSILLGGIFGLWLIWSDALPALGVLDSVNLPIMATEVVDGIEKQVPVTFSDLLIALLAGVITYIAAKNLPALLEIAILQRLPMESSIRYAITTISQYLIVMIGIVAVFSHIGLEWSNIQWLVAALSVGLGFGLQEIVANFISGIIILFERPVRIGDLVTIGDATGNVTQIRIRATTIRNWEKQELLVPNKELITGRVLNWSLSDQLNRLSIPVGIAYGSDARKGIELIRQIALDHPRILDDPEPVVTFEAFGDNSLTIRLRCYLDKLEYRLPTINELHLAINEKLNKAGIVIAFPQRDIHFDPEKILNIKIHSDGQ